jgi:hypothetical protein
MEIKRSIFVALLFFSVVMSAKGQAINITGDQYHLYGPNSTWSQYLQIGGNGQVTDHAFVAVTNGNLHLDSRVGFGTYINHYNKGNTYINPQGGRVGVGTTDPATTFEVRQSISGWTMNSRVNAASVGEINGFKFYSGYIGDDKWAGIASIAESEHSNKTGLALYSGMTERLRISGDGNVGIGTLQPLSKLHIAGDEFITIGNYDASNGVKGIQFTGFRDVKPNYFGASIEAVPEWGCCNGYPSAGFAGIKNIELNFNVHLNVDDADSKMTAMSIRSNGNVGIGTSNPTELFNVNGNAQLGRLRLGNAVFSVNSRNSINSFNSGQDPNLLTGWIAADFGGSDNASDRLVIGSGFGGRTIIGTHNYNLTQWGGDLIINPNGSKVGIGTFEPKEMLSVNGKISAVEIKVNGVGAPDYVFEEGYKVVRLDEVESYIKANKHLPEMPSAKEFERDGMAVGEMNKLLLKKIEELTLYLIEQKRDIDQIKQDNKALQLELQKIKEKK